MNVFDAIVGTNPNKDFFSSRNKVTPETSFSDFLRNSSGELNLGDINNLEEVIEKKMENFENSDIDIEELIKNEIKSNDISKIEKLFSKISNGEIKSIEALTQGTTDEIENVDIQKIFQKLIQNYEETTSKKVTISNGENLLMEEEFEEVAKQGNLSEIPLGRDYYKLDNSLANEGELQEVELQELETSEENNKNKKTERNLAKEVIKQSANLEGQNVVISEEVNTDGTKALVDKVNQTEKQVLDESLENVVKNESNKSDKSKSKFIGKSSDTTDVADDTMRKSAKMNSENSFKNQGKVQTNNVDVKLQGNRQENSEKRVAGSDEILKQEAVNSNTEVTEKNVTGKVAKAVDSKQNLSNEVKPENVRTINENSSLQQDDLGKSDTKILEENQKNNALYKENSITEQSSEIKDNQMELVEKASNILAGNKESAEELTDTNDISSENMKKSAEDGDATKNNIEANKEIENVRVLQKSDTQDKVNLDSKIKRNIEMYEQNSTKNITKDIETVEKTVENSVNKWNSQQVEEQVKDVETPKVKSELENLDSKQALNLSEVQTKTIKNNTNNSQELNSKDNEITSKVLLNETIINKETSEKSEINKNDSTKKFLQEVIKTDVSKEQKLSDENKTLLSEELSKINKENQKTTKLATKNTKNIEIDSQTKGSGKNSEVAQSITAEDVKKSFAKGNKAERRAEVNINNNETQILPENSQKNVKLETDNHILNGSKYDKVDEKTGNISAQEFELGKNNNAKEKKTEETLPKQVKNKETMEKVSNQETKIIPIKKYGFRRINQDKSFDYKTKIAEETAQTDIVRNNDMTKKGSEVQAKQEPKNFDNILKQVENGIKMDFNSANKEMKIRLHPEELGELKVKIKIENDIMKAEFTVENSKVKEALESRFNQLKSSLKGQGVETSEINVFISNENEHKKEKQREDRFISQKRKNKNAQNDNEESGKTVISKRSYGGMTGSSGINVLA